ncbi:DUF4232 domain-containing protein [Streptomyces sp. NPDC001787]|uniref:DUF4232 domain-containing protein n=1 Tax=Streptomyces sp. NPDC001787 TaxID=3154523 RepID=UPI00331F6174
MNALLRITAISATALVSVATLTACQDTDTAASPTPAASSGAPAPGTAEPTAGAPDASATPSTGESGDKHTEADSSDGGKSGYSQVCGSNDVVFTARSETQAGGYILITAKARPGITCSLEGLPVVAFGSDGTEAANAEQVAGDLVTLSGSTTAYAGVNPKTTNTEDGKELNEIIVSAATDDPAPVSLKVGSMTVDKPIVTNWHTAPQDAVPGNGGTDES